MKNARRGCIVVPSQSMVDGIGSAVNSALQTPSCEVERAAVFSEWAESPVAVPAGKLESAALLLERLAATLLLAMLFPVLALASLITVAISRQSPFVAHRRVGRSGRCLWVLKLRTMWQAGDPCTSVVLERLSPASSTEILPKSVVDPRITSRFAAICRRYSIDELPQLWQVARGEMSLVGPRPLTQAEIDGHYGADASLLLSRRPGITGLWQILGRSRLTYAQRRRLDLFMIRKWSAGLYVKILVLTIPKVLTGRDAW